VKIGGIIAGHDFLSTYEPDRDVTLAVCQFAVYHRFEVIPVRASQNNDDDFAGQVASFYMRRER